MPLDWPLTQDSVVVEVGGYEGRWSKEIAERYHPRLYVFEPQRWAYKQCRLRLWGLGVRVFNYGLGENDEDNVSMGGWHTDGASFMTTRRSDNELEGPSQGRIREVGAVLNELGISEIDLIQVNCEGCEFALLPHMQRIGLIPRIHRLSVQFHTPPDMPYLEADVDNIFRIMGQTHNPTRTAAFTLWTRR